ncbi:MAG: hypothetical protein WCK32_03025 [Chlorobiaceae bacterium]
MKKNDFKISPSSYIHNSNVETYRPIAEIVEELNAINLEARETDEDLREILRQLRSWRMIYNNATRLNRAQSELSHHKIGTKRAIARVTGHPTSRLQRYRLTEKGCRLLEQLDKEGGRS